MRLIKCTWPDIEAYLASSNGLIVPIGSVEQHGPTGPLGTDALCAEAIALKAGEDGGMLVAPTIAIGMAQHHLAFPGTISLRPSTLCSYLGDYVASLTRAGFRRFYFLNGHGGNVAPVSTAFSEIHAASSLSGGDDGLSLKLANWFDLPGIRALLREIYPTGHGSHATPSEIAITQHVWPETARHAELEPKIAPDGRFGDAEDFRRRFPDGRMGADVSLARPDDGKRLLEAASAALVADYGAFMTA